MRVRPALLLVLLFIGLGLLLTRCPAIADVARVGDGHVVLRPQFTKYSAVLPADD